jgi:hypothetical protein
MAKENVTLEAFFLTARALFITRSSLKVKLGIKQYTLTSFVALRMRTEGNALKNGEPTVSFSFTTMLQHTGRLWSRIS